MTLWRLEWLRLVRTRRLLALLGVFVVFGALGPVTAAYMDVLVARFGAGMQIDFPDPVPADGIAQYVSNAFQIGLLVAVFVAAATLAYDATPQIGVFLRSRVRSVATLIMPRWVMVTIAASVAHAAGAAVAWYETQLLLGSLPVAGMLTGLALGVCYLAFATAVTALVAQVARSALAAGAAALVVLLALAALGALPPVAPYLPSTLIGAMEALARDGDLSDFWRAAAVTVAATGVCLAAAVPLAARREL